MNLFGKALAASVQAKKGRLYAVIQFKENGKNKSVWRTLDLPECTAKSKVNKKLREAVNKFEEDLAEREKMYRSSMYQTSLDTPIFRQQRISMPIWIRQASRQVQTSSRIY